ncbi:hypothetical protein WJX73_007608 [Symbiochloris irregularis]|uniref:Proteasome assembly chaperone 1 n=1 Tax=Symbiochloris irregularis TaxID=706552 RepID=A0AAW1NWE2_9CHLO
MEDPLTGDVPASVAREEEEEAALDVAQTYSDPPALLWTPQGEESLRDGQLHCHLLVVALSTVASALMQPLLDSCQLAAEVKRPAKRAVAWARSLLQHIAAQRIVLLTSMPAVEFHAAGRPAQHAQFVLETAAAHGTIAHGLPYLPSGNLVAGLPAAILSLCQIREQPAIALVDVQEGSAPDLQSLHSLASSAQALLQKAGWQEADLMAKEPTKLAATCRTLDKASQRESRAALFV